MIGDHIPSKHLVKWAALFGLISAILCFPLHAHQRPRLAVLTDIGGDPDDQQSLIRLLVYANEFDINDQDGIADWMRSEFPGMHYILAKAPPGRDKREGTYRGMYLTGDESLTSRSWIEQNVLNAGPLGELYPTQTWTAPNVHSCLKEGDTPSWFYFLPLGKNDPCDPTKPGWGGQFERQDDGWFRDLPARDQFDPRTTVSHWRAEFQADFSKRMKWCQAPK